MILPSHLRVGTCVGHGQETRSGMLHLEVLVCEFLAVDRLATSALFDHQCVCFHFS